MKKYLALILGVMFLLGFAASAFAIHADIPAETQAVVAKGATQIEIGGEIRFRAELRNNTSDFNNDKTDEGAYHDTRIRLSIDAKVTPNTEGFVQIENNTEAAPGDTLIWGANSGSNATGIYGQGNNLKGSLNFLQSWILHSGTGLLGVPAGIKIGHMPLTLGNSIFFDHTLFGDDAIVLFADPMKDLHVALLTAKFREGNVNLNDDANGDVALFVYKLDKDSSISGDVTYVDDQLGLGTQAAKAPIHFMNFALRGNAAFSGFGLMADAEVQSGKVKNTANAQHGDVKFSGYAFMVGATYTLDPVRLSLTYAYGSGDDNPNDGKVKDFVTSLSATQHFTYVYDYRTVNACGQKQGGLCNTQYVKLGAGADLMKDLSADLSLYLLRAVKDFNGVPEVGLGVKTTSKNIGVEADWNIKYKIDRNLNFWVEGGYLFAGDFWRSVTGPNKSPDDAWAVRQGISLAF